MHRPTCSYSTQASTLRHAAHLDSKPISNRHGFSSRKNFLQPIRICVHSRLPPNRPVLEPLHKPMPQSRRPVPSKPPPWPAFQMNLCRYCQGPCQHCDRNQDQPIGPANLSQANRKLTSSLALANSDIDSLYSTISELQCQINNMNVTGRGGGGGGVAAEEAVAIMDPATDTIATITDVAVVTMVPTSLPATAGCTAVACTLATSVPLAATRPRTLGYRHS